MMLGHGLLAFSIVGVLAIWRGFESEKALALAVFAGLFAVIPDADMVLSLEAILVLFASGLNDFVGAFWGISYEFHRGLSHSLVTGVLASGVLSLYFYRSKKYIALFSGLVLVSFAYLVSGLLPAFVMGVFSILGLSFTYFAGDFLELKEFIAVSLFGLLSHPFGDVFTGSPPDFFYPLGFSIIDSRIVLAADPVLNLLAVFGLEVLMVWSAVIVFAELREFDVVSVIHPSVVLGLLYAPFYFFLSPPTLGDPYEFVYSILGIGLVNSPIIGYLKDILSEEGLFSLAVNITSTVTLAYFSYTMVYLIL